MLVAFRTLLYLVLLMNLTIVLADVSKGEQNHGVQLKNRIQFNNEKIHTLTNKIKDKKNKSAELKKIKKEKDNLVLENFKSKFLFKRELLKERLSHAKKNEKLELRYSPNGVCNNPCRINLKAVINKKLKTKFQKFIFYIDNKPIESLTPELSTSIYFSKNMLTDKQKKLLTKNIPLHRLFKLRVEGIISETKMYQSEVKKLVIKSLPSNLTSIDLITNSVVPFNKIQVMTSGINATRLQGSINSIPIIFEVDPSVGSSQVLYGLMPNLSAGKYKLLISNFNFDIQVIQMPKVSNPLAYVNNITTNSLDLSSIIIESGRYDNIMSNDGISLFSKYNEVIIAFDNFIKYEATPSEIQEIANIINASTLSDPSVYFFVNNDRKSIRNYLKLINQERIFSKVMSLFISSSFAQESSFKKLLMAKVTEAIKSSLTLSFNTIIDGMINKCYVAKARPVPRSIVLSEMTLTKAFAVSATAVIANQISGAYGYYATITAAQTLVILIGQDCEGDSTIIPKLVIQSQPISPIMPGESFQYEVKCDVGDNRYYNPGSILTKVTSRFDYISKELQETGDLIARDKLVHSCSGLGQDVIKDNHRIFCTTNLLNETLYYQNNRDQYEVVNPSQCNGSNNSYDVGTYLISNPDMSCNFVNMENNVNIAGENATVNQIVFDLSKKMPCPLTPKAVINYTKDNLQVIFDSTGSEDPSNKGLTYSWNFGDGQMSNTSSETISHKYSEAGTYTVSLTVTDTLGASDTVQEVIEVREEVGNLTICNGGLPYNQMNFTLSSENLSESFSLKHIYHFDSFGNGTGRLTCECKKLSVPSDIPFDVHVTAEEIASPNQEGGTIDILPYSGSMTISSTREETFQWYTIGDVVLPSGSTGQLWQVIEGVYYRTSCSDYVYK